MGCAEQARAGLCYFKMDNPSDTQIARQFFAALQLHGIDKLLSVIEGYGEALSNAEVLALLQEFNTTDTECSTARR
jgi:hypothetical protein